MVVVGTLLRFTHLDRKVYWHDEVFTSLRVAGYIGQQVERRLFTESFITAGDLLQYQQLPADASLAKTWASLVDHPEHPPVYYLMAYGWGKLFGASVAGYRAIAAIFGVLALPLMFWLGRELFPAQPAVAWVATALLAVSPIHFIYSQEAREYSFWSVGLLLANITLLRAIRQNQWRAWLGYSFAIALSFYGSLVTGLLVISHLVLVGFTQKPRQWLAFALASGLGLGLFAPWLWIMSQKLDRIQSVTAWAGFASPMAFLTKLWGLHYSAVFVDFNLPLDHWFTLVVPPLVILTLGIALGHIIRNYDRQVSTFLLCLLIVPPVVLIGSDLLREGQISGTTRYFFPSLIAVTLAMAAWLSDIASMPKGLGKRWGQVTLGLLLLFGILSCGFNTQARTWWNKGVSYHNPFIADCVNTFERPMLITNRRDTSLGNVISVSHGLNPETIFFLTPGPLPKLENWPGSIFLFRPNQTLIDAAAQSYQVEPVQAERVVELYQIVPLPTADRTEGAS